MNHVGIGSFDGVVMALLERLFMKSALNSYVGLLDSQIVQPMHSVTCSLHLVH